MVTIRIVGFGLLLVSLLPWISQASTIAHDIVPPAERIRLLQSGGNFMVMRHAATDHNQKDLDRSLNPDCSKQRNLSATGREQMQQMHTALQRLQVPVAQVFASPNCRTRDTAQALFDDYQVDPDLQFSISKDSAEAGRLAEHLNAMLMRLNPGPANTMIITHTSNIRDALGIWPKPEGVVLVIQRGSSGLVFKGIIEPDAWPGF